MAFKLINATEIRSGNAIIIDGSPCIVKNTDTSKTGKHGHAKVRIEAIGIFDSKKKVFVVPGHERFEVPHIKKLKGQVLNKGESTASIMDLESFETIDVDLSNELKAEVNGQDNVEYWDIDGRRIIKRKL